MRKEIEKIIFDGIFHNLCDYWNVNEDEENPDVSAIEEARDLAAKIADQLIKELKDDRNTV